jgi:hypothetical protein
MDSTQSTRVARCCSGTVVENASRALRLMAAVQLNRAFLVGGLLDAAFQECELGGVLGHHSSILLAVVGVGSFQLKPHRLLSDGGLAAGRIVGKIGLRNETRRLSS